MNKKQEIKDWTIRVILSVVFSAVLVSGAELMIPSGSLARLLEAPVFISFFLSIILWLGFLTLLKRTAGYLHTNAETPAPQTQPNVPDRPWAFVRGAMLLILWFFIASTIAYIIMFHVAVMNSGH